MAESSAAVDARDYTSVLVSQIWSLESELLPASAEQQLENLHETLKLLVALPATASGKLRLRLSTVFMQLLSHGDNVSIQQRTLALLSRFCSSKHSAFLNEERVIRKVVSLINNPDTGVQAGALLATTHVMCFRDWHLCDSPKFDASEAALRLLSSSDEDVRVHAVKVLCHLLVEHRDELVTREFSAILDRQLKVSDPSVLIHVLLVLDDVSNCCNVFLDAHGESMARRTVELLRYNRVFIVSIVLRVVRNALHRHSLLALLRADVLPALMHVLVNSPRNASDVILTMQDVVSGAVSPALQIVRNSGVITQLIQVAHSSETDGELILALIPGITYEASTPADALFVKRFRAAAWTVLENCFLRSGGDMRRYMVQDGILEGIDAFLSLTTEAPHDCAPLYPTRMLSVCSSLDLTLSELNICACGGKDAWCQCADIPLLCLSQQAKFICNPVTELNLTGSLTGILHTWYPEHADPSALGVTLLAQGTPLSERTHKLFTQFMPGDAIAYMRRMAWVRRVAAVLTWRDAWRVQN